MGGVRGCEDNFAAVADDRAPSAGERGAERGSDSAASGPGLSGSVGRELRLDAAAIGSVPSGSVCRVNRANTGGTAPADSWSGGARPGVDGESFRSLWLVVAWAGSAEAATVVVEAVNRRPGAHRQVNQLLHLRRQLSVDRRATTRGPHPLGLRSRPVRDTDEPLGSAAGVPTSRVRSTACQSCGRAPSWHRLWAVACGCPLLGRPLCQPVGPASITMP